MFSILSGRIKIAVRIDTVRRVSSRGSYRLFIKRCARESLFDGSRAVGFGSDARNADRCCFTFSGGVSNERNGHAYYREPGRRLRGLQIGLSRSRLWNRDSNLAQNLSLFERRREKVHEKVRGLDPSLAFRADGAHLRVERERRGRPVGRRIRMSQAASDGALVPNLNIADLSRGF